MISYQLPRNLPDAVDRIAAGGVALAGGTIVTPTLVAGMELVDLRALAELSGIVVEPRAISFGAMEPLAAIAAGMQGGSACAALHEAAAAVGNPHIRRIATLGGNLGWTQQPTDLEAALLALDAEIEIAERARSAWLPIHEARDFLRARRGLVLRVRVPLIAARVSAFAKLTTRRATSAGIASIAASAIVAGPRLRDVRIVIGGFARDAQRASQAEAMLASTLPDPPSFARVGALVAQEARHAITSDGEQLFRRRVLDELACRVLTRLGSGR